MIVIPAQAGIHDKPEAFHFYVDSRFRGNGVGGNFEYF